MPTMHIQDIKGDVKVREFRVDMSRFGKLVNYGTTITATSIEKAKSKALKMYGKDYPYIIQIWERN